MRLLTLLVCSFIPLLFFGQCPNENLLFTNQIDIDSFNINYPECKEFQHSLEIEDSNNGITNLDGLINLESIQGDLRINSNPSLESLIGLSNLVRVNGLIIIARNEKLKSTSDLKNLKFANSLNLQSQNLDSLDGFNQLTELSSLHITIDTGLLAITGLNIIEHCEVLSLIGNITVQGLKRLNNVDLLSIRNNNSFTDFQSIINNGIDSVSSLFIKDSNSFNTKSNNVIKTINRLSLSNVDEITLSDIGKIKGLSSLVVSGSLKLNGLESISNTSIDNLVLANIENLESFGSNMYLPELNRLLLIENNSLNNIQALEESGADLDELIIEDNSLLSFCAIEPVCEALINNYESVTIEGNSQNCEDNDQVLQICTLSSNDSVQFDEITIWPNPVHDYININLEETINYLIYSIDQKVVTRGITSNQKIDVSELERGMYLLYLRDNNTFETLKFIKQ